ncbi:MAG TPA: hypothetical protein PK289_05190 [Bacteroidia bacterium]|jgi:TM2 domain-containing membrane protein YozV|nr:hypothetical protein [Bacteroidia bacterium]HRG52537.1 hypothetical protein [Bacteroidia bacterium]
MSKTRIFLLIAWITGFASFQGLKAAEYPPQQHELTPSFTPQILTIHTILPAVAVYASSKCIESLMLKEVPVDPLKKKKFISALFALPFPLGFVGAHRVMLGSGPWVPVVYVATLGGCFGLLPLVDFCFIIFSKDITPFENNAHIFMWIK